MKPPRVFDHLGKLLSGAPDESPSSVAGGCIHHSWEWGPFFIKTNEVSQHANFQSEALNLQAIRKTGEIRVPEVIHAGKTEDTAYLVLERLELTGSGKEAMLGEQLAALHHHFSKQFGFSQDNFIGATPQPNGWSDDWPSFFRDRRIRPLLDLLSDQGIRFAKSDSFISRLPELIPDQPHSSLLHGDLWGGNKAFLPDGTPVVFDPACYYGDAAADIAMSTLFGGFGRSFYEAYRSWCPFDEPAVHQVYNLYHILNHAVLFGGSYVAQARQLIDRFA